MTRPYKLIDGPMDGQWIAIDGEYLTIEGYDPPPVSNIPSAVDISITRQRGRYSKRDYLTNALQWDGWDK